MFKIITGFIKDAFALANPWQGWMVLILSVNIGLLTLLVLDNISLVIDVVDVFRYWMNEQLDEAISQRIFRRL